MGTHRFFVQSLLVFLLLLIAGPMSASGADWPQWRGPERDGSVPGAGWPDDLNGLEPLWRVELGKGYPGPIVAGDRVFVVETADEETVAVRALERDSGRELWRRSWKAGGSVPFFARANGDWVRATPTWDGDTLYVGDMEEVLVALDGATGQERWRLDFPERFGTGIPDFGFVSAPLVDGDHLFVQAANSLVKLKRASGEVVWRKIEHDGSIGASGAFSSPVMATLQGRRQILVQTRLELIGLDPDSGETLWIQPVPSFRGMNILTPVVWGDTVFTSTYRNKSFLYAVSEAGEGMAVEERWVGKPQAYMSSPVLIGDHAYVHLGNGRLTCLDLETGEGRWTTQPYGKYWSMAFQGDTILALDSGGELMLIRANPERFELLDSKEIASASTWGHLAISGDQIFVRELEAVAAFSWKPGASPSAETSAGE